MSVEPLREIIMNRETKFELYDEVTRTRLFNCWFHTKFTNGSFEANINELDKVKNVGRFPKHFKLIIIFKNPAQDYHNDSIQSSDHRLRLTAVLNNELFSERSVYRTKSDSCTRLPSLPPPSPPNDTISALSLSPRRPERVDPNSSPPQLILNNNDLPQSPRREGFAFTRRSSHRQTIRPSQLPLGNNRSYRQKPPSSDPPFSAPSISISHLLEIELPPLPSSEISSHFLTHSFNRPRSIEHKELVNNKKNEKIIRLQNQEDTLQDLLYNL